MDEKRLKELLRRRHGVATSAELRAEEFSQHTIRWALRSRKLIAVRHGVYAWADRWAEAGPEERHVLQIVAHQRLNPRSVAKGASAAIAQGLPVPGRPPVRPTLTARRPTNQIRPSRPGGRGLRGGAVHRLAHLERPDLQVLRNGVLATSVERTVLDCAREWDRPWGLAVADAALYRRRTTGQRLIEAAAARLPVTGAERARWVVEHTRPAVESPLESLARAVIVLDGLPEPTPQVWVDTRLGPYRVDLLDARHRLVTEADGRIKYTRERDMWDEKRREDAIREQEYRMIRFTMEDYADPDWLVAYRRLLTEPPKRR